MSIQIPAQWAKQGIAIPTVCARHGRPEVRSLRHTAAPAQAADTTAPPAPIIKKLNPVWYIALVGGILLAAGGAFNFLAGPTCGAETMRPGDVCETVDSSGMVTESTYEQERAFGNGMVVAGAFGVLAAIGAGIRIRQWNRALRRAWAEQPQAG